ncbi:MAG: class I SAM-dependent methyltransferase [Acidimicrobiales bacterium]
MLARLEVQRARRSAHVDEVAHAFLVPLEPSTELATFFYGDFLEAALPEGSYGFVSAIASVHHMDFELALGRMKRLLHPGGCSPSSVSLVPLLPSTSF